VLVALLFLFLATPTAQAQAGVIYVDDDSACAATCGGSWATAYPNLQDGLAAATPGSEIWVAAGIYYPDEGAGQTDNDRNSTFQLLNGVALYGGFAGTETQRSERDWEANVTVLSGDVEGDDITNPDGVLDNVSGIVSNNVYHVVTSSGTDNSAILDGFTITGGNAHAEHPVDGTGGGLHNDSGSATLSNLVFQANRAAIGGGIGNAMGALALENVRFSSNEAYAGGAMFNSGYPLLPSVDATGDKPILDATGAPSLNEVAFLENRAEFGGGMVNDLISPTLTSTTFISNTADWGGGLYNYESNTQLNNAIFIGNEAFYEGGGMLNDFSSPTLQNSLFYLNYADAGGGMSNFNVLSSPPPAAAASSSERYQSPGLSPDRRESFQEQELVSAPQLTSVTFISNAANIGAGLYNILSTPVLSDVTFTRNDAAEGGGGAFMGTEPPPTGGLEATFKSAQTTMHAPSLTNVTFISNTGAIGGGLYTFNISPTLKGVSFSDNFGLVGGGLASLGGNPALEDVTFTANFGLIGGGLLTAPEDLSGEIGGEEPPPPLPESFNAMESSGDWDLEFFENLALEATGSGSMQVNRATFINNGAFAFGGAVASLTTGPQLTNVHFENNAAGMYAGAMFDVAGNSSMFEGESSESSSAEANGAGVTSLTNVTFISNTVVEIDLGEGGAGALYHIGDQVLQSTSSSIDGDTSINLLNVSFTGNSAPVAGAALFDSATPALVNVLFNGNYAAAAGAMGSVNSNPILTNVTFAGNYASDTAGALLIESGFPLIQNSIFWANEDASGSGASIVTSNAGPVFSHSLIQGSGGSGAGWDGSLGTDGGGNIDADPLFVREPDPGDGDWSTHDDNDYGNLQLQTGSPAVDAGDNSADLDGDGAGTMTIADIPEDLAGDPRIVFGTVDMGAFEQQSAELGLIKSVSTASALPGQPITFTLSFSNTGFAVAHGVVISDPFPAELTDVNVQSTLPLTPVTGINYAWQLPDLAPGEGGEISISAVVSPELSADTVFTNTAIISTAVAEEDYKDNVSTASVSVVVPRVSFSDSSYTVSEGTGTAVINVTLDMPNPYAPVQVAYSTTPGTATPGDDYTPANGVLTIPAGSSSASFDVPVFEDNQTEPAETVQLTLSNTTGAAPGVPVEATLTILDGQALLYLPLIVHDEPVGLPDLVISDISVTADGLEVVVANVGDGPASTGFWVDAYINPDQPPQHVNDVWWRVGDEGLVWGVAGNALPLDPGESLTLTYGDAYYVPEESGFSGTIAAGAQLYAQADSANTNDPYGGIVENHEATGGAYNNIMGPVTAGATLQAPAIESNGLLPDELPTR
jgi:uncharacterized repeat protein (TIGR01451 family)